MTTKITLTTHDWPVRVEVTSRSAHSSKMSSGYIYSDTAEFVPAHTNRDFYISNTSSIRFIELESTADGLDTDTYNSLGAAQFASNSVQ